MIVVWQGMRRAAAGIAASLAACCLLPGGAAAQHITVVGQPSPLSGPNYAITANLGQQVGGNLFHSFGIFGLNTGETATFSGPSTVANVIGRVTGGSTSSINGTITSTISGANLYLINPAGFVFGPQATINVSGSFHATSADYLKMSDGAQFQATNPSGSTLSAAPPAAFGFLTATPGQITVNGMQPFTNQHTGAQQTVPTGKTFDLVGGPVTIQSGTMLLVPSGTIRIASAAAPGEVPVDPTNVSGLTVANFGPVGISGNSVLEVGDAVGKTSGGSIFINAGTLTIGSGGFLDASNYGTGAGGQISLRADTQIALSGGAAVSATSIGTGRGADITLTTGPGGTISASGGTLVDVGSASVKGIAGPGPAGQLTVTTGTLSLTSGAIFGSEATGSAGAAPISISANSIVIDGSAPSASAALTGIRSDTVGGTAAADITVNTGALSILANGEIVTNTFGAGNAGRVTVAVAGGLSIDATGAQFSTGIGSLVSPGATGNAGAMTISAGSLSIVGGSGLAPKAASGKLPALTFLQAFAGLSAQTWSSGAGGSIALSLGPGPLQMSNGGVISSSTGGAGQGGTLTIAAQGPLTLSGTGTAITAAALAGASGNAGSVVVSAPQATITAGAQIASTTAGTGAGGPVTVTVAGALLLDGEGVAPTQIAASATGAQSGPGGAVTVSAGSLTIQGGAQIASTTAGTGAGGAVSVASAGDITLSGPGPQITALSTGSGDAGSIMISAPNMLLTGGAAVSTEASSANGGNITIAVTDFLHLVDSQITTSVKGARGNGGNIAIDPQLLVLDGSQIIAQAVLGHGGNITITANDFFPSADSLVSASSSLGISGTVEIIGPRVDLNGSLVVLPSELRNAAAVLRDSCAARGARPRSSLTEGGRGGLPPDPEATVFALYLADRDFAPGPPIGAAQRHDRGNPSLTTVRLQMHCG